MSKTLKEAIEEQNKLTHDLYQDGVNHQGTKLQYFKLEDLEIYAINADHAKNILYNTKIDLDLI